MSQIPPEQTGPTEQTSPVPPRPDLRATLLSWMEQGQQITARWLYELGGWVFGGLIAAAIMLFPALISLGFADRATLIAGLTLAVALPFDLAGLVIIRYFKDLTQATEEAKALLARNPRADDETIRLQINSKAFTPAKRRVMDSAVSLSLVVGMLFTLISIGSALWRVSWVVTLLFLIACILGLLLVLRVVRYPA
jgi:hypothetical protein